MRVCMHVCVYVIPMKAMKAARTETMKVAENPSMTRKLIQNAKDQQRPTTVYRRLPYGVGPLGGEWVLERWDEHWRQVSGPKKKKVVKRSFYN